MADAEEMKKLIAEIIGSEGVENLSAKTVREKLEVALKMEPGALKPQKAQISELIDTCMEEAEEKEDAGGDDDDDDGEGAPAAKKARKAPAAKAPAAKKAKESEGAEPKPEKTFSCTTRTGDEPPRELKKAQSKILKSKDFLAKGGRITLDICGNKLTADPREFSSGGKGWYTGGKIEMTVNGKTVWAQAGINITIPGSQNWS